MKTLLVFAICACASVVMGLGVAIASGSALLGLLAPCTPLLGYLFSYAGKQLDKATNTDAEEQDEEQPISGSAAA